MASACPFLRGAPPLWACAQFPKRTVHVRRLCQVTPSPTATPSCWVMPDSSSVQGCRRCDPWSASPTLAPGLPSFGLSTMRYSTEPSATLMLAPFGGQTGNDRHQRCKRFPGALKKSTRANSQTCLCHFQIDVTNPAIGVTCPESRRTNWASYHCATIPAMSAAAAADAAAAKVVLEKVQRHSAATRVRCFIAAR